MVRVLRVRHPPPVHSLSASTTISSTALAATEGINTGSWKGTLGDDNLHWVVAGDNPDGLDVNLTLGGVQLNGANKLIIQTEVDLDATVLGTYVQICDWLSSTDVDVVAERFDARKSSGDGNATS